MCYIYRDIIRNAVNASSDDCVLFVGSGCTGTVHKLIDGMGLRTPSNKPVVDVHMHVYTVEYLDYYTGSVCWTI